MKNACPSSSIWTAASSGVVGFISKRLRRWIWMGARTDSPSRGSPDKNPARSAASAAAAACCFRRPARTRRRLMARLRNFLICRSNLLTTRSMEAYISWPASSPRRTTPSPQSVSSTIWFRPGCGSTRSSAWTFCTCSKWWASRSTLSVTRVRKASLTATFRPATMIFIVSSRAPRGGSSQVPPLPQLRQASGVLELADRSGDEGQEIRPIGPHPHDQGNLRPRFHRYPEAAVAPCVVEDHGQVGHGGLDLSPRHGRQGRRGKVRREDWAGAHLLGQRL